MPFEIGGRSDKQGNRYEIHCIIYEMLKVLDEENSSVVIEALGEDEIGTDILVTRKNGETEHQQCKARNASNDKWRVSDLKKINAFTIWKTQLRRDPVRKVALVSPLVCTFLVDLHNRACNTSDNPNDFISYQIENSGKEFQDFYRDFCYELGFNRNYTEDVSQSIDFLRRISYKQMSEEDLKEHINHNIKFLFSTERQRVYDAFISLIVSGDILGKEITQTVLRKYFTEKEITFRLIEGDRRIAPRVKELNQEYRDTFIPLQGGLVYRKEFDDCIELIEKEKSFIISGNAGYGKSACTEAVINYCEENHLPYIAIKLDRRVPQGSAEIWSRSLGLPCSISFAIDSISKNQNAIIILDQLDALRWTQANSSEALSVCMELIREVKNRNKSRKKKIIIAFVCRTYDLDNDNNIKLLFKNEEENNCITINIGALEEDDVKSIIGEEYEHLSLKLINLLKIPSNLYIWQHLEKENDLGDCLTTSHLIERWYEQICRNSVKAGIETKRIRETISNIVDELDRKGRLFIPKSILNIDEAGLDYLISSEMIIVQNKRVGFVHQSILDYYISRNMMKKYYEDLSIQNIIGEKNNQNPGRRYQVQMFLQNILEYESSDFISIGKDMLISDDIRYYVKYVFYEILGQITEPDSNITQFILEYCNNELFGPHLLNYTIMGKKQYITTLRENGILEQWFLLPDKHHLVFNLLQSIAPNLDGEDIAFIRRYAFYSDSDDEEFMRCFFHELNLDSDELFELRMEFYERYPIFSGRVFMNAKTILKQHEKRIVRLISFWLKNKIHGREYYLNSIEEELWELEDVDVIKSAEFVLDELLQHFPKEAEDSVKYSAWSVRNSCHRSLERTCVKLVKKANRELISKAPEIFWAYYEPYMAKGYPVFNELILTGMKYMPARYSNQIMHYLSTDIDSNVFDYTSGAEGQLDLVGEVLKTHSRYCDGEFFLETENAILRYISPYAVDMYKRRIEENKSQNYIVYWSFWGDLQYILLKCLPEDRMSRKTRELLKVLDRRFDGERLLYSNSGIYGGGVISPISGKTISMGQWLQIVTNEKLKTRDRSKWIEGKGVTIESSLYSFANDFKSAVRERPQEMIDMIVSNKEKVLPAFVDSLFSGLYSSEVLEKVNFERLENLFLEFLCDMKGYRATCFCGIIEKMSHMKWKPEIIAHLKSIALDRSDLKPNLSVEPDKKEDEIKDCEYLENKTWNHLRGSAVRAMAGLLWKQEEYFSDFKPVLEEMTKDDELIIRFAVLFALWPSYNIEREWAEQRILKIYESDIRTVGFRDSKDMLLRLHSSYKDSITKIIELCFYSDDKRLIETGGYALCECYLQFGGFEKTMISIHRQNERQVKAILEMAIEYLGLDEYREGAKRIILSYKDVDIDIDYSLVRIFSEDNIDYKRDSDFLLQLMSSKVSRRIVYLFIQYLEEKACSLVDYSKVILELCDNVLCMSSEDLKMAWGLADEISKLIIALYDETVNSNVKEHRQIADRCLDLWDIMFEKQLGSVREISRKLMER